MEILKAFINNFSHLLSGQLAIFVCPSKIRNDPHKSGVGGHFFLQIEKKEK